MLTVKVLISYYKSFGSYHTKCLLLRTLHFLDMIIYLHVDVLKNLWMGALSESNFLLKWVLRSCLTLKGPGGGGGGGIRPPLDVLRDNFAEFFLCAASFHDFFLSSFAQLLALFSEKSGVRFESYATLCNQASAQNLKIFWICVQNIWKMAFCAKTPFWALKCNICIHYS